MSIAKRICDVDSCNKPHQAHGYCANHDRRYKLYGDPLATLRHGRHGTPEYVAWKAMRQRCNDPNVEGYKNYGQRGITYNKRWESFVNFYADMGDKPSPKHSLERTDNDKGYSAENCIWGTRTQQSRNTRTQARPNRGISRHGKKWKAVLGVNGKVLYLGVHTTRDEAIRARDLAQKLYWG